MDRNENELFLNVHGKDITASDWFAAVDHKEQVDVLLTDVHGEAVQHRDIHVVICTIAEDIHTRSTEKIYKNN